MTAGKKSDSINSVHALEEFLGNIKARDQIKARLVLEHFSAIRVGEQRRILMELNKCEDDEFVVPLLVFLMLNDEETMRAYPTLAETITSRALNNQALLIRLLSEPGPEQLFYLHLAGDLRLQEAGPQLIRILLGSTDNQTILATIKTLGLIGTMDGVNALSEFLYTDNDELVAAAIQALGQIATPTAMQRLSERLGRHEKADILILDVFGIVQDEISLRKLNDALQSHAAHLRNYSRSKMVAIGEKVIPILAANLFYHDPDLQILSLNILAEMGDRSAVLPVRKLLNTHPANPNLRFAAYEALAHLPGRRGDYLLATGMTDSDHNVRLAAARAIDRNFDELLAAGIRNMIKNRDSEAISIIKTIIDSQAEKIFVNLAEDKFFLKIAKEYLALKVHPEVRDFYVQLLRGKGEAGLAADILERAGEKKTETKAKICAVDDSRLILSIYRTLLTELGYEPVLFQFPAEALVWLEKEKPLAVCTDLNMPGITGIELIRQVRQHYAKEALPIIMVTTQNEVQDNKAAFDAGANSILYKPFDLEKLRQAFTEIL